MHSNSHAAPSSPTPSTARAVNSLDALPKASDDPTLGESFLSSFHDRSTSSSAVPLRRKNTACGTAVNLQWERSRREVDLAASHRLTTSAVSLAIAKEEREARDVPSCYLTSYRLVVRKMADSVCGV